MKFLLLFDSDLYGGNYTGSSLCGQGSFVWAGLCARLSHHKLSEILWLTMASSPTGNNRQEHGEGCNRTANHNPAGDHSAN